MSDVDKVTDAVNNIAQAFSDLHGGSELREEIARLKAKSAMQAGEITKLLADKATLKKECDEAKKATDELRVKLWNEREMDAEAGAEMVKLREKVKKLEKDAKVRGTSHTYVGLVDANDKLAKAHKETSAKLERMQSANDTLARNNATLRARNEELNDQLLAEMQKSSNLEAKINKAREALGPAQLLF